ncbi:MAG: DNA repair protein RecN [Ignavibacteria bacterium CG08_land_8_20_14_0_20_37_9]|nr:MAG: DNA repair protein RecN [Ignavibacteria bacterium CG08_land_8_20_14_0_20_37_9]
MLKTLYIKDYALLEQISIEFEKGLNIITGETGAGKSILIDAMSLLLGERASNEVIRKGAEKAIVEGIFSAENNERIDTLLEQNEIEKSNELIVRRELSVKGSNRCFLNDTPVALNVIKEVGNLLVDLHGQHEHQSLLRTETHIEFLDDFGSLEQPLSDFKKEYDQLHLLQKNLNELRAKENLLKEKKDLYEFQRKEIEAISPLENEDESISSELHILENSEQLLELTNDISQQLYDSEKSIYDSLINVQQKINTLAKIDKTFAETSGELQSVVAVINDITNVVRKYNAQIELEPQKLEELRSRFQSINLLKKKYGGTLQALLDHYKKILNEIKLAESFEDEIKKMKQAIHQQKETLAKLASELSQRRNELGKKISKEVKEALKVLGIPQSIFEVKILQTTVEQNLQNDGTPFRFNSRGYDEVEFFISTNLGEDTKPLSKVASGGEISRIMLALKTILARNDKLPLLIFDEIDTGISGRISQKVGQALKNLAAFHQIISITHQPQIAALADIHFAVEKKIVEDRVVSSIKKLKNEERIREVAKLLSGEVVTETSLQTAKELMSIQ